MLKLISAIGLAAVLSGCVAYPAGYGYADPGYAYGPDYGPAYGYGTINVWAGGGGGYHHGDYHHGGWDHGRGRWEGGRGGGHGGGHGGGGGGHGR
ncbi:hypothetical protein DR64_1046 [Paraburkholderia xenovorans LB400]|uniref:hypothetical protein n=1 Tax=Paraburkholderia xenovorans TaxID=36873 RepID=UPI00003C475B|nr:hypothetical protein [Paraburkholderia xenovorans]AIP32566.1 hypothetical protein DR64_1046 [Paraburkholderia xenovorans LB400]